MKLGTTLFITFFALFWSSFTLFFDYVIARDIANAVRSSGFTRSSGQIRSSIVTRRSGSKGTSSKPDITYAYTVDGREYTGNRVRYGTGFNPGRRPSAQQ